MSRRIRLLWYTRNVSRAHYGMDDDGLFNAECACGVTLAGNEPATFADAERSHAEQVRMEPRDRPCGPVLPAGIPGIAPAPAELAAAEERGRRRGVEERDELRALLRDHVQWLRGLRKEMDDEICPDGAHIEWCSDATRAIDRLDAALATRDSAPECGHLLSRDLGAEWRCGKPAGHEGPHSGTKP